MAKRYALGLDFGTASARAVLVDVETGDEAASHVYPYPHGVMDSQLPRGVTLGTDWVLQHPRDYLQALETAVPEVMRQAGASPEQVVGIGVDFTSCTVLPATAEGTPLCLSEEFSKNPHAWVKLWKHHAAQPEADRLTELLAERDPERLGLYGGKVSSEWLWPKAAQIADEAPEVWEATERLVEAGDWIVWTITGVQTRSACQAGYKAMWSAEHGDVDNAILADLHPGLDGVVGTKVLAEVAPVGKRAGGLNSAWAKVFGLREGTPVAVALIDAHSAVPAAGIAKPGDMLLMMGTSMCHMALGDELKPAKGIAGVVRDGILPGLYGYEAGQPAVGDIFEWFVRTSVPPEYHEEAAKRDISIYQLLEEKAGGLRPGESGLLVLDWWNGNRSTLQDADLSGLIVGLTLETTPEEIYRALIEGTAFGTRMILDACTSQGIPVTRLTGAGGLAEKNALLMQIYADVTERPIRVAAPSQATATGCAIHGAVAAGADGGGYNTFDEAIAKMGGVKDITYAPQPKASAVYRRLYSDYHRLYQTFGQGGNDVMHRLKNIKREVEEETDG
jgi:L-ribulokinase